MKELQYPFDSEYILKKSKYIKKQLINDNMVRVKKKIAILGGSTTHDIIRILELFLLNQGIEPTFYESEYGQYWQDAIFGNEMLDAFHPDLIYVHTSLRNIIKFPTIQDDECSIETMLSEEENKYINMWESLQRKFNCSIIQNNFEYPFYRFMGNKDACDIHGRVNYVSRLNERFYRYIQSHNNIYLNDINYLSACYGLDQWSDPFYYHMYKYTLCIQAIPVLSFNICNIIKSIFGKNKKGLVLDLDNTLWGGVIGDDGIEGIEIGQETSMGQVFQEFQMYIKQLKDYGILLNVDSKNDIENAKAGLNHPDSILKPEDFLIIKANWEPKSQNIKSIAEELNIGKDSLVFVDDNPAERQIVECQVPEVAVPRMGTPEQYIRILDHSGYFEMTNFSEDDTKRNQMYLDNAKRSMEQEHFADYQDYLQSLEMSATIRSFDEIHMARIAQLTNKSNQFNLTTLRCTQGDITAMANSDAFITLYGRLSDKFGDNGLVTVVVGEKIESSLHIRLWLMSCRVLKRDMEYAMMDCLVEKCAKEGIFNIIGYYYKTAKNGMVKDFYGTQGFTQISETENESIWELNHLEEYKNKNHVIIVNKEIL